MHTFDLGVVALGLPHKKCRGLAVQRICGVWIAEELGEEDLEYVDHVVHG